MSNIRVVSLRGSYEEMGYQYGTTMADEVRANIEDYDRRFRDQAGLSRSDVDKWGRVYRESTAEYNSDIAVMLTALAEAAEVPTESIFALNARTELLYGTGYSDDGCTALAVLGTHTAHGSTLIAQNWDWHPEQGPLSFLLSTQDEEGFSVLTLAEAGMLAKAGLNSAGLGLTCNLLISDLDTAGPGVPFHIYLRGVLQSRTMSDAIKSVTNVRKVSSGNVLIADAAGEAIDLELTPGPFGRLLPSEGLISHANHFDSGIGVQDKKAGSSALTLLRAVRVRHLLEDHLRARDVTDRDVHQALSDHFSFPDAVCRHINPHDAPEDRVASVYSLVMDLSRLTLAITPYPVCEMPTETFSVDGSRIQSLITQ